MLQNNVTVSDVIRKTEKNLYITVVLVLPFIYADLTEKLYYNNFL